MTTERPSQSPRMTVPGLRVALAVSVLLALVGGVLAAWVGGSPQVLGVAVGAVVVVGFFAFGTLSTGLVAAYAPRAALLVALLTYTLQVVLLGAVLLAVARSGIADSALDARWLGGTVIVGTLAWTAALVTHALRNGPAATEPLSTEQEVRR